MTTAYPLPRETRQTAILDGNGTTGPYGPTAFKVFDVLDVKVWRKDAGDSIFADVTATSTIAKTADLAYDTVSVTLATAAPDTTDIVIQAARRAERSASVLRGASIDGDQLEKELTKLASTHSEMRRDLDRAYKADLDAEPRMIADIASGHFWIADENGNFVDGGSAGVLADGVEVNDDETLADESALRPPSQRAVKTYVDALEPDDIGAATAEQGAKADSALQTADVASFGQYASATASKTLQTDSVWDDLAILTDAATITVNLNAGYDFGQASNTPLALGGNRELGAPSNARNGKKGILWFTATGSTRTLTLNAAWVLATGVETGPYSIATTQTLGVAYVCRGATVIVTGIVRTV